MISNHRENHSILKQTNIYEEVQNVVSSKDQYQGWNPMKNSQQIQHSFNILSILSNNLKSYQNLYNQSIKTKQSDLKSRNKHRRCQTFQIKLKGKNTQNYQKATKIYKDQQKQNINLQQKYDNQGKKKSQSFKASQKRQKISLNSRTIFKQIKLDLNETILSPNTLQEGITFQSIHHKSKKSTNQMQAKKQQLLQQNNSIKKFKICKSYNLTDSLDERIRRNKTSFLSMEKNKNYLPSNKHQFANLDDNSLISKRGVSVSKRKFSYEVLKLQQLKFGQKIKVTKKRRDAFIELFGYKHRKIQLNSTLKDFSDSAFFVKQKLNSRQIKTREL